MPARARSRLPRVRIAEVLLAAAWMLLGVSPALAQQASLQVTQGPYYTGVPIDMQVVADDFDEDPTPDVDITAPSGATLQFVQARPQVSSMVQIINGHVTQTHQVRFGFVYQLTATAPGRYTVGPFTVRQGAKSAVTRSITVLVADVPAAGGQRLRIVLPDHPIFIGQRVPVTVEWWTEAGLADKLYNQRLNVPLFLDTTNFQFLDEEKQPSRISISVDVAGGTADFPADVRQVTEGDKKWAVRSFSRTVVPVAAGHFDLGRPALYCEEATAFQRDIFGSRVPSQTRRVRVTADDVVLDVQAVPQAGRPASYAGAIGEGFTMDVAADRTVLQTGDPVKLTFTIHGDGALDSASLPPLEAAGLSPKQFRASDGDVAGIADAGGKHFEVAVRVIDPAVREIPPIEYSWFNPSSGRFESTHSQPIALSVRAATVVGAGDVVSAAPAESEHDKAKEGAARTATGAAAATGRAPAFTLTGADLSIETDLARLRSPGSSLLGSAAFAWTDYGAGILALGAGLAVRRRRNIDPAKARLRKQLRALHDSVATDRSAKEVAAALRKMASLRGDAKSRPESLDDVLAGLDETAYAPGGEDAGLSEVLRNQAVSVADAILEQVG